MSSSPLSFCGPGCSRVAIDDGVGGLGSSASRSPGTAITFDAVLCPESARIYRLPVSSDREPRAIYLPPPFSRPLPPPPPPSSSVPYMSWYIVSASNGRNPTMHPITINQIFLSSPGAKFNTIPSTSFTIFLFFPSLFFSPNTLPPSFPYLSLPLPRVHHQSDFALLFKIQQQSENSKTSKRK